MFKVSKRVTTLGAVLTLLSLTMGLLHSNLLPVVSNPTLIGFACAGPAVLVVVLCFLVNPLVALALLAALIDFHVTRKLRAR